MLENLHNYFVLFHFIDIILPEVISMNSNDFYQLAAELNVMDFTKSKPNYADLGRKYDVDYRTVKKYHGESLETGQSQAGLTRTRS